MFNPEKVTRYHLDEGFMDEDTDGNYVEYEDYDQLLTLYNGLIKATDQTRSRIIAVPKNWPFAARPENGQEE